MFTHTHIFFIYTHNIRGLSSPPAMQNPQKSFKPRGTMIHRIFYHHICAAVESINSHCVPTLDGKKIPAEFDRCM